MQTGPFAQAIFPGGQFIGEDRYADFVQNYFHTSIQDFETQVKKEIEINRLEAMVTGGITVSDQEVRDDYRQQGTKIKFDYAVINAEDLRKQINPTDAELQAFFKQNAARYKDAIPETRKLAYIALNQTDVPDGAPPVTNQQVEQYYQAHQKDFQVPEEVKVRHILIKVDQGRTPRPTRRPSKKPKTCSSRSRAAPILLRWPRPTPMIRAARKRVASWA